MSCSHCVNAVTDEVSALIGVGSVAIDLETKTVAVQGIELDRVAIIAAIEEAGFEVVP